MALKDAREAAALYARLKAANDTISRLTKQGEALTAQLNDTLAAERKAEREALFSQFSNMRVSYTPSAYYGEDNVLAAAVTVHWQRNIQTGKQWDSGSKEFEVPLHMLARQHQDAYLYLIDECPNKLPAAIMNLSGSPVEAVAIYCQAKARGYFRNGR